MALAAPLACGLRQAQPERVWGLDQEQIPLSLSLSKAPRKYRDRQSNQSGTRSAALIAAGRIRSATTAHLSPSTITSATKPRLL